VIAAALLATGTALTGWSPQGLPLFSYSTDEGFGYGARVQLVDHGDGALSPYRLALTAQFYQTTKDVASHFLSLDAPALFGSKFRLGAQLGFFSNRFHPYYGLGNESVYHSTYDACADRAPLASNPDQCAGDPDFKGLRWYQYDQRTLPDIRVTARYDLEGPLKLFGVYRFRFTRITPLYGAGDLGQHDVSQLVTDAQAGLLTGWNGADPSHSSTCARARRL
jgi:hypothetical protein